MTKGEVPTLMQSLPGFFRPLFWSFHFDTLDVRRHKKTIIIQTVNYGSWKHWEWLAASYGKSEMANALHEIPVTEFRKGALALARVVFNFENHGYAHRSTHARGRASIPLS